MANSFYLEMHEGWKRKELMKHNLKGQKSWFYLVERWKWREKIINEIKQLTDCQFLCKVMVVNQF